MSLTLELRALGRQRALDNKAKQMLKLKVGRYKQVQSYKVNRYVLAMAQVRACKAYASNLELTMQTSRVYHLSAQQRAEADTILAGGPLE
jgi:hypothetical protein